MTKSDIKQTLHAKIREHLLGTGPWPPDNESTLTLFKQIADWDLQREDGAGNSLTTALGRELRIGLLSAFLGLHELFEIPRVLEFAGALSREAADELEVLCINERGDARDDDELAAILQPILARIYLEQFGVDAVS